MACCGTKSRIQLAQLVNHTGANNPRSANNPITQRDRTGTGRID